MRISRNFRLGEGVQAQLAENKIEHLPRYQAKVISMKKNMCDLYL